MRGKKLRYLRIVLWGLVLFAGLGSSWLLLSGPRGAQVPVETLGQGDYRLLTTDGAEFSRESLVGQPSLVFFGFTHCPDVCPMTMAEIAGWKEALGPSGADIRVWFITVDPERDSAAILADYIGWMPDATGVTGSPQQIALALASFGVIATKVPLEDGEYSVDHSASVLLFDRAGRFDQRFNYAENPASVIDRLRQFQVEGS